MPVRGMDCNVVFLYNLLIFSKLKSRICAVLQILLLQSSGSQMIVQKDDVIIGLGSYFEVFAILCNFAR